MRTPAGAPAGADGRPRKGCYFGTGAAMSVICMRAFARHACSVRHASSTSGRCR